MKSAYIGILSLALLAAPLCVFAQAPTSFQALSISIATILNAAAVVVIGATFVVYFYSIVSDIFNRSRGESTGMRQNLLWGILILFVMFSFWGIIHYVQNSLFNGPPPASTNGISTYTGG